MAFLLCFGKNIFISSVEILIYICLFLSGGENRLPLFILSIYIYIIPSVLWFWNKCSNGISHIKKNVCVRKKPVTGIYYFFIGILISGFHLEHYITII